MCLKFHSAIAHHSPTTPLPSQCAGVCNIFRYSIERHNSLLEMLGWGLFGFLLLICAYFLFEFLTPRIHVDEEIAKDNRSVGLISFTISLGLSFVIGASII